MHFVWEVTQREAFKRLKKLLPLPQYFFTTPMSKSHHCATHLRQAWVLNFYRRVSQSRILHLHSHDTLRSRIRFCRLCLPVIVSTPKCTVARKSTLKRTTNRLSLSQNHWEVPQSTYSIFSNNLHLADTLRRAYLQKVNATDLSRELEDIAQRQGLRVCEETMIKAKESCC